MSRSGGAECAVELELLAEDSTTANVRGLEQAARALCEAHAETWVPEKSGIATVVSGGNGEVLCSMAGGTPGTVRWRFRAIHRLEH